MDIAALLNRTVPCPYGCRNMVLRTPAEHERGYCEYCAATRFRCETAPPDRIWGNPPLQRVTYRTEAEAYGEGIEDDD